MRQPTMGLGRRTIPPANPLVNRKPGFQFNQLANPVPPTSLGPSQPPENDFMDRYNALISDRPDRLAYREHALSGPPSIERGKWAKLGAILAAGGTALGQNDATAGMNLGLGAYYEPERKARETWELQRNNLGALAGMESEDINARLQGLEFENTNYWKNREAELNESKAAEDVRSNKVGERIQERAVELQGLEVVENNRDGWTYLLDRSTGRMEKVGQTGFTTEEDLANRAKELRQELDIKKPYEVEADNRRAAQAYGVANIAAGSRENVAASNNAQRAQASRDRIIQAIATKDPKARGTQVLVDLTMAAASDSVLKDVEIDNYMDTSPVTGLPQVRDSGWMPDSAREQTIKNRLKLLIEESLRKTAAFGDPSAVSGGRSVGAGPASGSSDFEIVNVK